MYILSLQLDSINSYVSPSLCGVQRIFGFGSLSVWMEKCHKMFLRFFFFTLVGFWWQLRIPVVCLIISAHCGKSYCPLFCNKKRLHGHETSAFPENNMYRCCSVFNLHIHVFLQISTDSEGYVFWFVYCCFFFEERVFVLLLFFSIIIEV